MSRLADAHQDSISIRQHSIEEARPLLLGMMASRDRTIDRLDQQLALWQKQATGDCPVLVGAYRDSRLIGAGLAVVKPGRVAEVWPVVARTEEPSLRTRLYAELHRRSAREGAVLAQLILGAEAADATQLADLEASGYERAANLQSMSSWALHWPGAAPLLPLEIQPYQPHDEISLTRMIEATYRATLDCPALDGLRQTHDVLAGYQATGTSGSSLWYCLRNSGELVGCLLMSDHPELEQCELVYLGLIPSVRGQGWGRGLVQYAQWKSRQLAKKRLVLAVDTQNEPALRAYVACGFQTASWHELFIRRLDDAG